MEEKERDIREAVFKERFRIVNKIEEEYADSMSDDLAILKTILTDEMLDLGEKLGWVKTVRIVGAGGEHS